LIRGFLAPAALGLAALAIPILLTYMLRSRRPPQLVSSTFLWEKDIRNVTAIKPWQRLRPSVLLFLQLLALLAIVFGLAGPYRSTSGISGDHIVLVLDASGSMKATDTGSTSRIEAARLEARKIISELDPSVPVSIVQAGPIPTVLVSSASDHSTALEALERVDAGEGGADFAEAFLLAESLETPARPVTLVLVSDGGLTSAEQKLLPPGAIHRPIGETEVLNIGIRRVDVLEGATGFEAVVEVRNYGVVDAEVELTVLLDGVPHRVVDVTVDPKASVEQSFEMGSAPGEVIVRIDARDSLPEDDTAYAVLDQTRPRNILLVTPGNVFLEALLMQLPGAEVEVTEDVRDASAFDLVVYDRVEVTEAPKIPAMYIANGSAPGVEIKGELDVPRLTYIDVDDSLMESVDLSELVIARSLAVEISGGRTLVGTRGSPLISIFQEGLARRVWMGFDLHESNFPVTVAFPIFADHLLRWLSGSDQEPARIAGEPLRLSPPAGTTSVSIELPSGQTRSLAPEETLVETNQAGFYRVEFLARDEVIADRVVALSFPNTESSLGTELVEAPPAATTTIQSRTGVKPLAWILLAVGLLVLMFEWWWAHGRPLPGLVARGN
jgi:hypothetical protein